MGACSSKGKLGPGVHDELAGDMGWEPGLVQMVQVHAMQGSQHIGLEESRATSVARMPVQVRADFVSKVYTVLSVQAFMATLISLPFEFLASHDWASNHLWFFYLSLVGILALVVTAALLYQPALRDLSVNLCFSAGLTLLTGIVVGFPAAAFGAPAAAIGEGTLAAIFGGLAVFACLTRADFMGTGPFLLAAFGGLSAIGILLIFVDAELSQKLLGGGCAILVSLYTVYNTQLILSGEHLRFDVTIEEHMFVAASTFPDIVTHIWHSFYLLGSR